VWTCHLFATRFVSEWLCHTHLFPQWQLMA